MSSCGLVVSKDVRNRAMAWVVQPKEVEHESGRPEATREV
jgi:hypothetical protein